LSGCPSWGTMQLEMRRSEWFCVERSAFSFERPASMRGASEVRGACVRRCGGSLAVSVVRRRHRILSFSRFSRRTDQNPKCEIRNTKKWNDEERSRGNGFDENRFFTRLHTLVTLPVAPASHRAGVHCGLHLVIINLDLCCSIRIFPLRLCASAFLFFVSVYCRLRRRQVEQSLPCSLSSY